MKIISADQRYTAPRGAKILLVGPTGVGKTSLLRTLDPAGPPTSVVWQLPSGGRVELERRTTGWARRSLVPQALPVGAEKMS